MITQQQHVPFDNASGSVYRVLGPPGTGKTSWLVHQAERAAEKYGAGGVRVVSMTRAAAREFARRKSPIPAENISTLHALAYRALNRPKILEPSDMRAWNEQHGSAYGMLSALAFDGSEGTPPAKSDGDAFLMKADLYRARRMDPETQASSEDVRKFARKWREWKQDIDRVDFTDLLERALDEIDSAPGRPEALFVDEAQDLSALELALVEKWGSRCRVVVIVGDPDQSIYAWRGADPGVLLGAPPFAVLSQSWRVPRAVHERAMGIIRKSSTWSGASYQPHARDGDFRQIPRSPSVVLDEIEEILEVSPLPQPGDPIPIMLLASCGYMVAPFVSELRKRCIPYFNPYRVEWNPLLHGVHGKTTAVDRLLAFGNLASPRDWRLSIEPLLSAKRGGPVRGTSDQVKALADDAHPRDLSEWLGVVLEPDALFYFERDRPGDAPREHIEWWLRSMKAEKRKSAEFAVSCALTRGLPAVLSPSVAVGTIHSVKGGEADIVYLSTEVSRSAARGARERGWYGQDSLYRQFYVGATRARDTLVAMTPGGTDVDGTEYEVAV